MKENARGMSADLGDGVAGSLFFWYLKREKVRGRTDEKSDSFVLSGTSAKFSITFDLAWKVMKDMLIQHYSITGFVSVSPGEVLRTSYEAGMIADDVWLEMMKVRNQLDQDYDGVIVKEYCQKIIHEYIDRLYDFRKRVEEILG